MTDHTELKAEHVGVTIVAVPGAVTIHGKLVRQGDVTRLRRLLKLAAQVAGSGPWEVPEDEEEFL